MKSILTFLLVMAGAAVTASAAEYDGLLPGSNELNTPVVVSTAITPAAVVVSSAVATKIDTAVNAALSTAMGAGYKRAEVQVQMTTNVAKVYYGFSPGVTTTTGFLLATSPTVTTFTLGKGVSVYMIGDGSTTVKAAGLGYK